MWEAAIARAETKIRRRLINCRVTFRPLAIDAFTISGVFHNPHDEWVPGGDGSVEISGIDAWVDVRQSDLIAPEPRTRDEILIEKQNSNGTYSPAIRFRVKDTRENGTGSLILPLLQVIA